MIKAPNWAKDAAPTLKGWEKNGELLISRKHTQAQIDEFNRGPVELIVEPLVKVKRPRMKKEDKAKMLTEAPVSKPISEMSDVEIDALEKVHDISIDPEGTQPLTE